MSIINRSNSSCTRNSGATYKYIGSSVYIISRYITRKLCCYAATKLVALTEVVKLPIEAVTEEMLRSGLTLREALVEAVLTETPSEVIRTVWFASVIVSKEPAAMSFS